MSNWRTVALALVAWLVVVVAGAGLVWTVISRAGEGVASPDQPALDATSTERQTPSPKGSRAPDTQRRTWQGAPGQVTAECVGPQISVANAQPVVGFRIEQDDTGPEEIRVEFESLDGSRTRVEAVCRAGTPVFEVDR